MGRGGRTFTARQRAPAKLNLGLRVTGRRPDGYHNLDSVFAPIALADELAIAAAPGTGVSLAVEAGGNGVPGDETNLAVRAAQAYLGERGETLRLRISLRKRIPAAAGLGGGSSDAAAVLRALRDELGEPGEPGLPTIALRLGADVPFFLRPAPARVRGIGERIEPLKDFPRLYAVLAHPGQALSTAAVFDAYRGRPGAGEPPGIAPLRRFAVDGRRSPELDDALRNDLEPIAEDLCPAIAALRASLRRAGAPVVAMSGSGPTLYALFNGLDEARGVFRRLSPLLRGSQRSWLTETVSPPAECVT